MVDRDILYSEEQKNLLGEKKMKKKTHITTWISPRRGASTISEIYQIKNTIKPFEEKHGVTK